MIDYKGISVGVSSSPFFIFNIMTKIIYRITITLLYIFILTFGFGLIGFGLYFIFSLFYLVFK